MLLQLAALSHCRCRLSWGCLVVGLQSLLRCVISDSIQDIGWLIQFVFFYAGICSTNILNDSKGLNFEHSIKSIFDSSNTFGESIIESHKGTKAFKKQKKVSMFLEFGSFNISIYFLSMKSQTKIDRYCFASLSPLSKLCAISAQSVKLCRPS